MIVVVIVIVGDGENRIVIVGDRDYYISDSAGRVIIWILIVGGR